MFFESIKLESYIHFLLFILFQRNNNFFLYNLFLEIYTKEHNNKELKNLFVKFYKEFNCLKNKFNFKKDKIIFNKIKKILLEIKKLKSKGNYRFFLKSTIKELHNMDCFKFVPYNMVLNLTFKKLK